MKRILSVCIVVCFAAALMFAQNGTPSSKATAAINTAVSCTVTNTPTTDGTLPLTCKDIFSGNPTVVTADNFAEVMKTTVKVSNSQSLFVSPSLVTGLYTNTKTTTKTNSTSTAQAMGGVYLRAVLKDGSGNVVAVGYPAAVCTDEILGCYSDGSGNKGVVLDSRVQTLTQALSACVVNVDVAGTNYTGTCDFTSTVQLILQTTSAHTFNFIFPNVGVGVYTVSIQAAVNSNATVLAGTGSAVGAAAFGLGSVTVDSVRMVHDFSF